MGAYLIVNALLILIWAITGFGYFWPGWVLAVWGVHLILGARVGNGGFGQTRRA